jgi:hypothetical protein
MFLPSRMSWNPSLMSSSRYVRVTMAPRSNRPIAVEPEKHGHVHLGIRGTEDAANHVLLHAEKVEHAEFTSVSVAFFDTRTLDGIEGRSFDQTALSSILPPRLARSAARPDWTRI